MSIRRPQGQPVAGNIFRSSSDDWPEIFRSLPVGRSRGLLAFVRRLCVGTLISRGSGRLEMNLQQAVREMPGDRVWPVVAAGLGHAWLVPGWKMKRNYHRGHREHGEENTEISFLSSSVVSVSSVVACLLLHPKNTYVAAGQPGAAASVARSRPSQSTQHTRNPW